MDIVLTFSSPDTSDRAMENMTRVLQQDFRRLGIPSRRAETEPADSFGKGVPFDINTLLVAAASAGALTAIINLIRDWALRGEGRKVKIVARDGDKSYEVEFTPAAISQKELQKILKFLTDMLDKKEEK